MGTLPDTPSTDAPTVTFLAANGVTIAPIYYLLESLFIEYVHFIIFNGKVVRPLFNDLPKQGRSYCLLVSWKEPLDFWFCCLSFPIYC